LAAPLGKSALSSAWLPGGAAIKKNMRDGRLADAGGTSRRKSCNLKPSLKIVLRLRLLRGGAREGQARRRA
jgi:hypothetical protein